MDSDDLDALQALVLQAPELLAELLAIPDMPRLIAAVLRLAETHGIACGAADLDARVHALRRGWLERWI